MNFLVVGLGSMGKRRVRCLQALGYRDVNGFDSRADRRKEAQERYKRYTESRRLFRETPDGKREYLTDKELTEARARAKQTVIDYCS